VRALMQLLLWRAFLASRPVARPICPRTVYSHPLPLPPNLLKRPLSTTTLLSPQHPGEDKEGACGLQRARASTPPLENLSAVASTIHSDYQPNHSLASVARCHLYSIL
jgi:hypothetical protein